MKKIVLCVALLVCVIFGSSVKAEACPYSPHCGGTLMIPHCGYRYGVPYYQHNYRSPVNGYIFICGVTNEESIHTFTCSSCGSTYDSTYDELKTCNELHSVCGSSIFGLCGGN